MSYAVQQTRRFVRQYKKLHDNIIGDVDAAVEAVSENPSVGDRKKGDLASLFVYKFHSQGRHYLLGYTVDDSIRLICLEAVGPHENFYRDMKR